MFISPKNNRKKEKKNSQFYDCCSVFLSSPFSRNCLYFSALVGVIFDIIYFILFCSRCLEHAVQHAVVHRSTHNHVQTLTKRVCNSKNNIDSDEFYNSREHNTTSRIHHSLSPSAARSPLTSTRVHVSN